MTSPLLANIALHGLETAVRTAFPQTKTVDGTRRTNWQPIVIRYADDLVILHEDAATIDQARGIAATWLAGMGLEFKPSKTRLTHTLQPHEGQVGFDFLGFGVRQHLVGKTHTGRNGRGIPLGYKTIITPSATAQHRHQQAIGETIRRAQSMTQAALITRLNRLTSGWVNYYATVASKRTFAKMDALVFAKLMRWAKRRHPTKGARWIVAKYWRLERGSWTFGVKDGPVLHRHAGKPIRRHAKVQGTKSVYDGDWPYWARRLGRHPTLSREVARLLKHQDGKCAACGLYFRVDDVIECDHLVPLACGGQERPSNRQLLHRHCHDQKTAHDGSGAARGTH